MRRTATVAAEAVGDAITRRIYSTGNRGPGLRGGEFTVGARGAALEFKLAGIRFVGDLALDGNAIWNPASGVVDATVNGISLQWSQAAPSATARIGDAVLTLPAP